MTQKATPSIKRHQLQGRVEDHLIEPGSLDQIHFRAEVGRRSQAPSLTFTFVRPGNFHASEINHRAIIEKMLKTMILATAGHFGFKPDDFKSLLESLIARRLGE